MILCIFSFAAAQESGYIGIRLNATLDVPYLGAQLGIRPLEPLELRLAYDVSLGVYTTLVDVFYTDTLGGDWRGYTGVGGEHVYNGWNGQSQVVPHLTLGAEYRSGLAGFFGELQPYYQPQSTYTFLGLQGAGFRLGAGINFYFF